MRTITTVVHILTSDKVAKRNRNKLAKSIENAVRDGISNGSIKVGDGVGVKVQADATPRLSLS